MRIGTYNVQGFRGYPPEAAARVLRHPDDGAAGAHFARVFEALRCDVLAVQEGPSARQMHRIAGLLGLSDGRLLLPAPLARLPAEPLSILDARTFSRWRPLADRWPFSRMGGEAHLELDDGSRLLVITLHLHPRHERVRRAEAAFVRERLAELDAGCGTRGRARRLQLLTRRADPRAICASSASSTPWRRPAAASSRPTTPPAP